MFQNKLLLSGMGLATLVALSGCDSDSGSSPSTTNESSDITASNSGATVTAGGNSCSVTKPTANSVKITMVQENQATTTSTATIVGDTTYVDYVAEYSSYVPQSMIDEYCDENIDEAAQEPGASVSCTGRTMTINTIEKTVADIETIYQSGLKTCKSFIEEFASDEDDEDEEEEDNGSIDENYSYISSSSGAVSCQVTSNTENLVSMVVTGDTATITSSVSYTDGLYQTKGVTVYADFLPQSYLDSQCEEAKADAAEEDEGAVVTCSGNVITETLSESYSVNPIPFVKSDLIEICNTIQSTGTVPDDEEEDSTITETDLTDITCEISSTSTTITVTMTAAGASYIANGTAIGDKIYYNYSEHYDSSSLAALQCQNIKGDDWYTDIVCGSNDLSYSDYDENTISGAVADWQKACDDEQSND